MTKMTVNESQVLDEYLRDASLWDVTTNTGSLNWTDNGVEFTAWEGTIVSKHDRDPVVGHLYAFDVELEATINAFTCGMGGNAILSSTVNSDTFSGYFSPSLTTPKARIVVTGAPFTGVCRRFSVVKIGQGKGEGHKAAYGATYIHGTP
jgi:hypothetical protein